MPEVEEILLSQGLVVRLRQDFREGVRLPSERALAEKYRCDRGTIRSAIKELSRKGQLKTIPRKGHYLLGSDLDEDQESVSRGTQEIPNVALLTFGNALQDPHIMDVIAGAIYKGTRERVHITLVDLSENTIADEITSLEAFCPGGNVAGFILCGKPPLRIRRIIEKSVKPCILLGNLLGEKKAEKMRFMRVLAAWEPAYKEVGYHLGMNNHRKVMLVCADDSDSRIIKRFKNAVCDGFLSAGISEELELDIVCSDIWGAPYENFIIPSKELAEQAIDSLDDHTALVVACGGVLGLEIWKRLLDKGISIPGDLSVVIAGGRNDHFIDTFGIASVFDDGWHSGVVCVEEVVKQLSNGDMNYGARFTNSQYLSRTTVGLAR